MIPRGLIIAVSVGVIAGAIFGSIFVDYNTVNELVFVQGPSLSILTEKTDFDKGEKITITIVNSGSVPLTFSDAGYGLQVKGLDGTVLYSPIAAQVISILEPREEIIFEWDQTKNDDTPVLEGTYKITSTAQDEFGKTIEDSITVHIHK